MTVNEPVSCNRCKKIVENEERAIIFNSTYHTKCFTCETCNLCLLEGFHTHLGRFYCNKCVLNVVPTCVSCKKPIGFSRSLKAMNVEFHLNCFVCDVCKKPFEGGRYFPLNGKPYCLQDYWNRKVELDQIQIAETQAALEIMTAPGYQQRKAKKVELHRRAHSHDK